MRDVQRRQTGRNAAERAADGCDAWIVHRRLNDSRDEQAHQRTRHSLQQRQPRRDDYDDQRQRGERRGGKVELRKDLQQVPELFVEVLPVTAGSPKKSCHSLVQMITAMPAVNPAITGSGMNLMMAPRRAIPSSSRITPASRVAICRPSTPYRAVMPARMTTKAPVGPAICTRLPPNSETTTLATIAV